jgi:hypothetical protein
MKASTLIGRRRSAAGPRHRETTEMNIMPEPLEFLEQRIRAAYARTEQGRMEWMEATLELAAALAAGRDRFATDDVFSERLENKFDQMKYNDRAALVQMSRNLPLLREVLVEQTGCFLPNNIWARARERFQTNLKPSQASDHPFFCVETASSAAVEVATDVPGRDARGLPRANLPPPQRSKKIGRSKKLNDLPNLDRYYEYVCDKDTRRTVIDLCGKGSRNRHAIWDLLIESIESGAYGPPNNRCFVKGDLRVILPWAEKDYASRFDLSKTTDLAFITEFLPAVVADREQLMANPTALSELIGRVLKQKKQNEDVVAPRVDAERLGIGEQIVFMYDKRLWPAQTSLYNWTDVCHACWYYNALEGAWRRDLSVQDKAIIGRHMIKWLRPLLRQSGSGCGEVVGYIFDALALNPDGKCDWPPMPLNYKG